jgi:hypothetical protein
MQKFIRKYGNVLTWSLLLSMFFASVLWYRRDLARRNELKYLSLLAHEGDLKSLRQLTEIDSGEAIVQLEDLAKDKSATAYSRVAAIEFLVARKYVDSSFLASLLTIDEPFNIRHAAATELVRVGCEQTCISAALLTLHSILGEQPTVEMTLPIPGKRPLDFRNQIDDQIKISSEKDCILLLKSNPCLTWKLARQEYANDIKLINRIRPEVNPC